MIVYNDPQGSPEWLAARKGVITGSRAKDCRDFKAPNAAEKKEGKTRGEPSAKHLLYAQDVARERCGGSAEQPFVSYAMRLGTEQEPFARMAYEARTGEMVEEAGFVCTDDRKFGCSVDGFVGDDGMVEIKTMVSSKTLFDAVVDKLDDEYIDQINFALWLLGRKWCDLCLWAPDLPTSQLTVRRIERDDNAIEALESDLIAFDRLATGYETRLRGVLYPGQPVDLPPPWVDSAPTAATQAPQASTAARASLEAPAF